MATKQTFTAGQVLTAAQLNTLQDYVGVVQVQSVAKTDTFTTTSTTFTDITGLSVSITPTSATNKVLVVVALSIGGPAGEGSLYQIVRGSTAIGIGDTAGSRIRTGTQTTSNSTNRMVAGVLAFLDTPATTSATTYKIQMRITSSDTAAQINRSNTDTDNAAFARGVSTITVYEVTP